MKKSIILLTMCLLAYFLPMQAEHMKFMGIPLTGTITQFQSKLQAKGMKYDKTTSQLFPAGIRAFKGSFAGEKADVYVYYDPTTKIVYRAKAVVGYYSESLCEQKYDEMKSMLSTKYSDAYETSDYREGHEVYHYVTYELKNEEVKIFGTIDLYVTNAELWDDFRQYLHIDYSDMQNTVKNDDSKMNDL